MINFDTLNNYLLMLLMILVNLFVFIFICKLTQEFYKEIHKSFKTFKNNRRNRCDHKFIKMREDYPHGWRDESYKTIILKCQKCGKFKYIDIYGEGNKETGKIVMYKDLIKEREQND